MDVLIVALIVSNMLLFFPLWAMKAWINSVDSDLSRLAECAAEQASTIAVLVERTNPKLEYDPDDVAFNRQVPRKGLDMASQPSPVARL